MEGNDQFDIGGLILTDRSRKSAGSILIDLQNNTVSRNSAQRSNSLNQHQQVVNKCYSKYIWDLQNIYGTVRL